MSMDAVIKRVTSSDEFVRLDGLAQADLIKRGEVTSKDLVQAAIRRIERINNDINAIASHNFDLALQQSDAVSMDGPFAGVPTLIKDVLSYPGHANGFGSRLLDNIPGLASSPYTEAMDAAGLITLGKSTTSEFGLLGTTETLAKGATRNPWDLSRSTGGSSGGAVAAVAAGLVPVAHASDGGGSIRGPASFCGLFGFKPSRGRTVSNGMPAELPMTALVSDHCVSRSVRDSIAWLMATEEEAVAEKLDWDKLRKGKSARLRIGYYAMDESGSKPSAAALAALSATLRLCEELGHELIEIQPPQFERRAVAETFFSLMGVVMALTFEQLKVGFGEHYDEEGFEPYTRALVAKGRELGPDYLAQAGLSLQDASKSIEASRAACDIILTPTTPYAAFPLGQYRPDGPVDALKAFVEEVACYTVIPSIAGWPAMSVPLYWNENGLPLGSHFSARQGQDDVLFSLALQLEEAQPWQGKIFEMWERNAWYKD